MIIKKRPRVNRDRFRLTIQTPTINKNMTTRSLLSTTAALFLALSLPALAADPSPGMSPGHKMDMSAMMKDKDMMRKMCAEMSKTRRW